MGFFVRFRWIKSSSAPQSGEKLLQNREWFGEDIAARDFCHQRKKRIGTLTMEVWIPRRVYSGAQKKREIRETERGIGRIVRKLCEKTKVEQTCAKHIPMLVSTSRIRVQNNSRIFSRERAASCYAVNLRIPNTKMGAGTSGPEVILQIRLDERNLQSKNAGKINREITQRVKQQERGKSTRLRMVRTNENNIRLSNALIPLELSLCWPSVNGW